MHVFTGHAFAINEDNVIVMNLKKRDDGVNLLATRNRIFQLQQLLLKYLGNKSKIYPLLYILT